MSRQPNQHPRRVIEALPVLAVFAPTHPMFDTVVHTRRGVAGYHSTASCAGRGDWPGLVEQTTLRDAVRPAGGLLAPGAANVAAACDDCADDLYTALSDDLACIDANCLAWLCGTWSFLASSTFTLELRYTRLLCRHHARIATPTGSLPASAVAAARTAIEAFLNDPDDVAVHRSTTLDRMAGYTHAAHWLNLGAHGATLEAAGIDDVDLAAVAQRDTGHRGDAHAEAELWRRWTHPRPDRTFVWVLLEDPLLDRAHDLLSAAYRIEHDGSRTLICVWDVMTDSTFGATPPTGAHTRLDLGPDVHHLDPTAIFAALNLTGHTLTRELVEAFTATETTGTTEARRTSCIS